MMRRLRGIVTMGAGALLLVASGAVVSPPAAGDVVLESHGWWYKANQVPQNLAVPPAPPGVASDGLFVSADPSGPFAIGAVRYLAYGSGKLTLEFSRDGNAGIPSIAACVALTQWDAAGGGRWEGKPIYDCARQSRGVVSVDRSKMSFQLDPTMQKVAGVYDIVLAPVGPVPFAASFNAPQSSSLVTDGSGAPVPATSEPFQPSDPSPGGGFGPYDTTFPVFDESRSALPEGAGSSMPPATPRVAAPVTPAGASPLALPNDRNERLAAMVGLGLLLLGAWWVGGRTVRAPRLLGSVAGRATAVPLEVAEPDSSSTSRFARPRG